MTANQISYLEDEKDITNVHVEDVKHLNHHDVERVSDKTPGTVTDIDEGFDMVALKRTLRKVDFRVSSPSSITDTLAPSCLNSHVYRLPDGPRQPLPCPCCQQLGHVQGTWTHHWPALQSHHPRLLSSLHCPRGSSE